MTCLRCQGLLVSEVLRDYLGTYIRYEAWRCVNCGAIFDSMIAHHQLEHPAIRTSGGGRPAGFRPTMVNSAR